MGAMVTVADPAGVQVDGHLALPAGEERAPAVIVIQEWWGLVGHIKDVTDRLAAEGFIAFAPDLYHGVATTEPDEAGKLMMDMERDRAGSELNAAVRHLQQHPRSNGRVAVIGFCMGGGLALMAACQNSDVAACVDFYGVLPGGQPDCDKLRAPVLGLFGGKDPWMPPDAVRALEESLRGAGKQVEVVIYPEADHAFFNDDRPEAYDQEAAADAWRRTVAFLRAHLSA